MSEAIMAKRSGGGSDSQQLTSTILPSSTLQWKNYNDSIVYTFPSGSAMEVRSNSYDTRNYSLTSAINLSNIKNIVINVENIDCGANGWYDGKGFIDLKTSYRGTNVISYNYILKDGQYIIDTSNLTGNHYLVIGCANVDDYGCYCNFDVTSVKCYS